MPDLKNIKRRFLNSYLLIAFSAFFASAQSSLTRESQIKAAFLFNFTQFVEWPAASFSSPTAPIIIGIYGDISWDSYLTDIVAGEKVNGRPLVVQRYSSLAQIQQCHILFISLEETKKMEQLLKALKGLSILTVSDAPDFLKKGGMIKFFTVKNKMHFQINLESTKTANLIVSSKLLRLADIFSAAK